MNKRQCVLGWHARQCTDKDGCMRYLYVDMGDSGSMDSGRPDTPDTDESSEVSICAFNNK